VAISAAERDTARRFWRERLLLEHARHPTADTALQLARVLWLGGEYADALARFVEARDRAPEAPEAHVSLIRSASMLACGDLERDALARATAQHPRHPDIALHAALTLVPDDPARAIAWLEPHSGLPLHRQYLDGIRAVSAMRAPDASHEDPRFAARQDGLAWAMRHARSVADFAGLPTLVLLRGLAAAPEHGTTLECGVYHGRSLAIIAARTAATVHGFDSFEGLPEAWHAGEGAGAYSTNGRVPEVAANVVLHPGWFEDTLPVFFAACDAPVRLLHVDCDLYSSTRTVLACARGHLRPGSVIVFDDLLGYPGYQDHELRAFEEFVREHGIAWELVAAGLLDRAVAVRLTHVPDAAQG